MNVDYHLIQSPFLFHHVYEFDHQYVTQVNLDLQTSVNDLISYSLFDDDYLMMVKSIILVGYQITWQVLYCYMGQDLHEWTVALSKDLRYYKKLSLKFSLQVE